MIELFLPLLRKLLWPLVGIAATTCAIFIAHNRGYHEGWDARQAEVNTAALEAADDTVREMKRNVADSHDRDVQVIQQLNRQRASAEQDRDALREHLAAQILSPVSPNKDQVNEAASAPLARCTVDPATVGLLNRARGPLEGPDGGATERADATSAAAPEAEEGVTGTDLALDDQLIANRYRELAIRHNALVDWVDSKCNAAAKANQ